MSTQTRSDESLRQVSWVVRVLLGGSSFVVGHVVQASPHALWVRFTWLPPGTVKLGERYRVEIHPGTGHLSEHTVDVRYLDGDVVGFGTDAPLGACEPQTEQQRPVEARASRRGYSRLGVETPC